MGLVEELEQADAVLTGAPMYNYTIPSTLKAWLDRVLLPGRTAGEAPSVQGTPVVVEHPRPGPRLHRPGAHHGPRNLAMSEPVPLYEASRKRVVEDATIKAKELAERLAA